MADKKKVCRQNNQTANHNIPSQLLSQKNDIQQNSGNRFQQQNHSDNIGRNFPVIAIQ